MKAVVMRNWPPQCFHPHQKDNYLLQQVGVFSKLLLSVGELNYTLTLLFPFFPLQLGKEKRAKAFVESLYGKDEGSSYISRIALSQDISNAKSTGKP